MNRAVSTHVSTKCRLCRHFSPQVSKCYKLSKIHNKNVHITDETKDARYVEECDNGYMFEPSTKTMMGYKDVTY
jgi:hypothetical protein